MLYDEDYTETIIDTDYLFDGYLDINLEGEFY